MKGSKRMKKLLAVLLSFSVLLTSNAIVFAKDTNVLEQNEVEETVETKQDGVISYLAIANPSVSKGKAVNIVVGVASDASIESPVLCVTNTDLNSDYYIDGIITDDGSLLFSDNNLDSGCYSVKSLSYLSDGQLKNELMHDVGLNAQFGVDTVVVDATPDAVVLDNDANLAKSTSDEAAVVVDDKSVSDSEFNDYISEALSSQSEELFTAGNSVINIVLDPGHGGIDGGTNKSFKGKTYSEKELNLKIAQYCKEELETYSKVRVYMTRNDDRYVGLEDRVNYAKSVGATIFVSIHNNSHDNAGVHGATVYYPNSNFKPQLGAQGHSLAQNIVSQLVALGLANHGAIIRNSECGDTYDDGSLCDYYSVIRNSKKAGFPGIIIEHAYISNESDATTYLGSNEALKKLGVADANGIANYFGLIHAVPGTEYQGINYKIVFDPSFYLNTYPDVRNAIGDNPQKALEHFVNCGIKEGRIGRPEFDVNYYKNKYPDLQRAFGNNLYSYYMHYLETGIKEGRQTCDYFDVISYKARYADLRTVFGDDLESYVLHYINFGKKEGRDGSNITATYTVEFMQNGDIIDTQQVAFGKSAKVPSNVRKRNGTILVYDKSFGSITADTVINVYDKYIYNGIDYTSVFDADFYLTKYADLKKVFGTDGSAALSHFVNFGMNEGRQGNETFNVKSYINLYPDLRRAFGSSVKQYYLHYINNGIKEHRVATGYEDHIVGAQTKYNGIDYSSVYDFNYYIKNNPDVLRAYGYDDNTILSHFVNFGMNEGRQAKESFSVKSYKNHYPDLRRAFGNNWKSYFMHYISNGVKEKRETTGYESFIVGAQTKYNGIDYSSVYDFNYYVSHNPDVLKACGYDENSVLGHFVNFGMREGRQAIASFKVSVYKINYGDLRKALGDDNKSYYMHYMNFGIKEKRIAS